MGKLYHQRFGVYPISFLDVQADARNQFITTVALDTLGGVAADVFTHLPFWNRDHLSTQFRLIININIVPLEKITQHQPALDRLLEALGQAFGSVEMIRSEKGTGVTIQFKDAILPFNKTKQAEANHQKAVAILLKY